MKILITINNFSSQAKDILKHNHDVDIFNFDKGELLNNISDYDVILVGLGLNIDKEVINRASNLKVIATATTGLDHIDIEYAKSKGIEVLSLKNETEFLNSITGTAELAFGLLLDLYRNISHSFETVKDYKWDRNSFIGHNLSGKILGIVGFGRLGKMMAKYAKSFGMEVVVCDPNISAADLGYKDVSFNELIKTSDVVSLHVHLSDETKNMFAKDQFDQMKDTSVIINTSRGKIVNESDILLALKNKKIAGYATDVLSDELNFESNGFENNQLVEHAKNNSNIIITPHIGGMTYESRENTDVFISKKINDFLLTLSL